MEAVQLANTSALLAEIQSHLEVARTLSTAILAVLIWEALTTFSSEYQYIWQRKYSFITGAYLICRYWTLASFSVTVYLAFDTSGDMAFCDRMVLWYPLGPVPAMFCAGAIMLARVYAIWNNSKPVLAVMGLFLATQVALQITMPLLVSPRYGVFPPGIHACTPSIGDPAGGKEPRYYAYFAAILAYDCVLMILVLLKSRQLWSLSFSKLAQVLLRDQILAFVTCTLVTIMNFIWYFRSTSTSLLAPLTVAIQPVAVCRLVLNLRASAEENVTHSDSGAAMRTHRITLPNVNELKAELPSDQPHAESFELEKVRPLHHTVVMS